MRRRGSRAGGVFRGVFGALTLGEKVPGRAHSAARSCATASTEKTAPCATAHRAWDAGNSPQKKATSEVPQAGGGRNTRATAVARARL